jgi:hypothetical protein
MVKQSTKYVTETIYGTHSFTSESVALAFETLADKIMFEFTLKIKQAGDDCFRFKVNNRYDLVFSEDFGLRLVEEYDPEPYVSTRKLLDLYEKGLIYELDRGVVSLKLAESFDLEKAFERYLQLAKDI